MKRCRRFTSRFGDSYLRVVPLVVLLLLVFNLALPSASLKYVGQNYHESALSPQILAEPVQPIHEIQIPQNNSSPLGITLDSQGNIWFAENFPSALVEYTPSNQTLRTFPIPTNSSLSGLIWFLLPDDNGNIWFAASSEPLLWRFSISSMQFANFSTGRSEVDPFGLALDTMTNQIWFTSTYTDRIWGVPTRRRQCDPREPDKCFTERLAGLCISVFGTRRNTEWIKTETCSSQNRSLPILSSTVRRQRRL